MAARNVWTYVFLRLRRWLLKQQPNKTVKNRFIKNEYQSGLLPPYTRSISFKISVSAGQKVKFFVSLG